MNDLQVNLDVKDGLLIAESVQDCTPIAEQAKRLHNEGMHGSSDFKHAAEIPNVFIEKYCNDHGILYSEFLKNKEHIRRVLNDPALAHFRIWKGRV